MAKQNGFFRSWFGAALDAVFPSHCLGCGIALAGGALICEFCLAEIPVFKKLFCAICKARLPENKKICHRDAPYLLGAATDYHDEWVRQLVHNLKFKFLKPAAQPLASLLVAYAKEALPSLEGFVVVPIPLSRARERERGFNQSALIGKIFSAHFSMEFLTELLVRERHTKAQSEINDFSKRHENVAGCFSVLCPDLVKGKNLIVIDDVTTSGATFFEAAVTLKRAGAKKIICLAAAKS